MSAMSTVVTLPSVALTCLTTGANPSRRARTVTAPAVTPVIVNRPFGAVSAPLIAVPDVTPVGPAETCTPAIGACPAESTTVPVIVAVACDAAPDCAPAAPAATTDPVNDNIANSSQRLLDPFDINPPL